MYPPGGKISARSPIAYLCALARVALLDEISFAQLQLSTGINVGQLTQQVQSNNPLVQTQMLAAAKDVRAVGTQTIDGVRTTHYAGSYPVSAGLASSRPGALQG